MENSTGAKEVSQKDKRKRVAASCNTARDYQDPLAQGKM